MIPEWRQHLLVPGRNVWGPVGGSARAQVSGCPTSLLIGESLTPVFGSSMGGQKRVAIATSKQEPRPPSVRMQAGLWGPGGCGEEPQAAWPGWGRVGVVIKLFTDHLLSFTMKSRHHRIYSQRGLRDLPFTSWVGTSTRVNPASGCAGASPAPGLLPPGCTLLGLSFVFFKMGWCLSC